ncbi:hypothetical protein [Roseibacillus ishigakijimensis]|uniref:Uncharacterized protein n=1 Tax=Roseibacillus ishigakijimensis TaxID=454146 RepID=A0A934RV51_9BACT|nr:hypothetical protein [Roseibacillus ishigakijimensis]MBK1835041.1 hypothetical protein [Roseibacillus ishigakijimensis]
MSTLTPKAGCPGLPKAFLEDPRIAFVDLGENQGCAPGTRYWVELRSGFVFDGYDSGTKSFCTVRDFKNTRIVKGGGQ